MSLHHDEIANDAGLVRDLIGEQCPSWAELPVTPVASTGTANAMCRPGDELVARAPAPARVDAGDRHGAPVAALAGCDAHLAWEMFDADSRGTLRHELDPHDDTWERARGWALSTALPALRTTSTATGSWPIRRRRIAAVLADG